MGTYIILFCTGIVVGNMNAIAGGGGLVAFPVLLWVGLPALTASATSSVGSLLGRVTAAIGYRKYLRQVPKIYLLLLVPCAIGAAFGAYLLRHTTFANFEKVVPLLILFAVLLFTVQPLLHFHLMKHIRSRHKDGWKLVLIGLALLIMCVYGGYFGAGLGFALLALLSFTNMREVHMVNAMKTVAGATVLAVAITGIYSAHIIHWHYGLTVAAGNLLGGYMGARLAQKVSSHAIRVIVIAIGLTTAGFLAFRYH